MRKPYGLVLGAVLVTALSLAGCGGGSEPEPTPTAEPTATPELSGPVAALAAYALTTQGSEFIEDCSKADVSADAGKVCANFQGERGSLRAYVLGMTFSEFTEWAFVEERAGHWSVVYSTAITPESLAVPGIPWPLRSDADVVVVGVGTCLNVREGPGLDQPTADCVSDGTVLQLGAGPTDADGFEWWQLKERAGWVVSIYLRYPDALDEAENGGNSGPAEPTPTAEAEE